MTGEGPPPCGLQSLVREPERTPTPMTDSPPSQDPRAGRAAGSRRRPSAQKIAAERQRRRTLMMRIGLAAVALVVVVIAGIIIFTNRQGDASTVAGVRSFSYPGGQHT